MTTQQKRAYRSLIDALLEIGRETVRKRGRRLEDLRFASRPANQRDVFYFNKQIGEDIWDMWHEIVQKAKIVFPEYDMAVVADVCSELFNCDDEEWEKFQMTY